MIVVPNVSNVIGVFTMGFGIMASVLTNNVSALAALANGLLPLRKVPRPRPHPSSLWSQSFPEGVQHDRRPPLARRGALGAVPELQSSHT